MERPTDTDRWEGLLFPFCLLEILAYFLFHLFTPLLTIELKKWKKIKKKHWQHRRAEENQWNQTGETKLMCFLPLQQLILIASDQRVQGNLVLPLHLFLTEQTISASFWKETVLILKVVSTTENMWGNSKIILLTFLHAFQWALKLKHRTVVCFGPYGAEIQMWKSVLKDHRHSLRENFFSQQIPQEALHTVLPSFSLFLLTLTQKAKTSSSVC